MIKKILLTLELLVAICFSRAIQASNKDVGYPLITNYKADVYLANPQNFGIIQDDRGFMYFANGDGVLVYDGSKWELIELHNKIGARALGKDIHGTIYTAGTNEIGYLQPDKYGRLKYISLIDSLGFSHTGTFRDILSTDSCIYFRSEEFIVRLNSKGFSYWRAKSTYTIIFLYKNSLFVQDEKYGLFKLVNDSLILAPVGKDFINKKFYFAKQLKNEVVLANRINGLYKYQPESKINEKLIQINSAANQTLIDAFIYSGTIIKDEEIVLGTNSGGCIIVNSNGEVLSKITKETGILQNKIHFLYVDRAEDLWIAQDNGISRCDYSGPISYWNEYHGLDGNIQTLFQHDGSMYIGSLQGLYYLKNRLINKIQSGISQAWTSLIFKIPNTSKEILLVGALEGVFILENNKLLKIPKTETTYKLYQSQLNPNIVYIGTSENLGIMEFKNGYFEFEGLIPNTGINIRSIVEKEGGEIWLGTFRDGVIRITPSKNILSPKRVVCYTLESGLPSLKNILLYHFNNDLVFATEQGFYRFDEGKDQFIPDNSLGNIFESKSKDIFNVIEDSHGGAYITQLMNYHGSIGYASRKSDGSYQWNSHSFNRIPRMMMLVEYLDTENNLWIGGSEGLFKLDQSIQEKKDTAFNTFVRRVSINRDSCIFFGNFYSERGGKYIFSTTQNESLKYRIGYRFNSIMFSYSAPEFSNEHELKYKFMLEGYDRKWSEWSTSTTKEYTNLNGGFYRFRVISKNTYDNIGKESSFEFTILPPWYRTIWAYILYFFVSLVFVYTIVYLNGKRLKAANIQLEQTVQERTNELSEVNTQLEENQAELEIRQEELAAHAEMLASVNEELEKLSIVARETDNSVIIMDAETNYEWVNEGFVRMYKSDLNTTMNEEGRSLLTTSQNDNIHNVVKECKEEKKTVNYQSHYTLKTGESIWIQTTITPIISSAGDIVKLIAIESDITKLKLADLEIQKQRDELIMLNSTKDKFFSIIAHDLKNPFNLMLGLSELIIEKIESGENQKNLEIALTLHQTSVRTYELLENLLTWSRSQSNVIPFKPEQLNIKDRIDYTILFLADSAKIKGIKLWSNVTEDFYAYVDKNMFFTILRNLVTNAIKFSREGDSITVNAKEFDDHIIVSVSDTGVGIKEEIIGKLFKVEENVKTEGTAQEPGTGLGLILCREFVEKNNGKMWVESTIGKGSCFSFTLQKGNGSVNENANRSSV